MYCVVELNEDQQFYHEQLKCQQLHLNFIRKMTLPSFEQSMAFKRNKKHYIHV